MLLHLALVCGAQGELEEAESCLRRVLAVEPGHEEAAATLMALLGGAGRRGAALRVYQALATTLEDELDVTPAAEIMALRARLVAQEAVPAGVPPWRVLPTSKTNVPTPSSSFVGRAWEVAEIGDLLTMSRLVTLTGPGGCGKTRLALEVAATRVAAHAAGVWLVELAALADPALVPRAVAAALGITERPGQPLRATLRTFLRPRDLLLVVDNCEHLIDACASLVADLLADCPYLRVLATSREGLAVAGERTYLVPSLATPDPAHQPTLERLAAYEAVTLFLERARSRHPALRLTAANAGAVAQICARLDGLPLALELAAARVGVLPVEGIAARLDDRFRLLTGGMRTALPRQQTLHATIDWSYALLSPAERRLMQRLAVFAGGWTLEAAAEVCAADGGAGAEVLDLLGTLVDKSLAQAREEDGAVRYRFLETVRAYAQEHLEASGDQDEIARRHAASYLALAEQAEPALWSLQQTSWFRRLAAEQDNLRAAITWALAHDEVAVALRLAGALWRFWTYQGDYGGWRRLIETGLARATEASVPAQVRAKALEAAGWLAFHQWDYAAAAALGAESLRLARGEGDPLAVRGALVVMAKGAYGLGRQAEAIALFDEALDICRAQGYSSFLAPLLTSLGMALAKAGEGARAEGLMEEALGLLQTQGETYIGAQTMRSLAHLVLAHGERERAAALFRESLRVSNENGHKQGLAESLEGLAAVCGAARQAKQAARLFGAADALRDAADQPLHPDDRVMLASYLAGVRAQLGDAAWEAAWAKGHALPLAHAITEAADAPRPGPAEDET
ncbi:MAG: BTAD domain-containing putative transcriptional regulator [Chloroflexota bacterium]